LRIQFPLGDRQRHPLSNDAHLRLLLPHSAASVGIRTLYVQVGTTFFISSSLWSPGAEKTFHNAPNNKWRRFDCDNNRCCRVLGTGFGNTHRSSGFDGDPLLLAVG
jgi:hypothetical protein